MRGVEVILDAIVATTGKFFGDVGPLISKLFMLVKNLLLLTLVDWRLIDVWVQVIVPSLAALFACARTNFEFFLKLVCYESPLFGAILLDEFHDCIILLLGPELTRGLLLLAVAHTDLLGCSLSMS